MSKDVYFTISSSAKGVIYKDKGSKFLGYAFPITTEDEVKPLLDKLKKEHHAARHWCYAWQLGVENIRYRTNDDSEPSNSAGKPIYGQLRSKNVTNILMVVVRYYGGINLGVGGLIQAYKTAAQYCLEEANIVEKKLQVVFTLKFEYKDLNKVMRFIKDNNLEIANQIMEMTCEIKLLVRKKEALKIEQLLTDFYGVDFANSAS
ncbi:MAG: IMPACT family protein [Flavobacteriaceae bacterium]|nr:IMPACT family protein [Flavobacteriaceae bacterium]